MACTSVTNDLVDIVDAEVRRRNKGSALETRNKCLIRTRHEFAWFNIILRQTVENPFHLGHVESGGCSFTRHVCNNQRYKPGTYTMRIVIVTPNLIGRLRESCNLEVFVLVMFRWKKAFINRF